jgi:hypothetical protein
MTPCVKRLREGDLEERLAGCAAPSHLRRRILQGETMARTKAKAKTIVLYPEAAFGPALNCVGIAQKLRARGHNPVFV